MPDTDYNAAWRKSRADVDSPAFNTEKDKVVGRNYNAILDNTEIGTAAKKGLQDEYPKRDMNCKSSDVAARYLAALVPRDWGCNVTELAKAIVGQGLGAALINVYQDSAPAFSNNDMKASLKIYQDWACPYEQLNSDKNKLKVGQPERNAAGQTVGIIVTGKMPLEV